MLQEDRKSHLVKQEASHAPRPSSVGAEADQANEHDDKQEDVRHKCKDHGNFGGLHVVDHHAGAGRSVPSSPDLSRRNVKDVVIPMTIYLPEKYLIQHIGMYFQAIRSRGCSYLGW